MEPGQLTLNFALMLKKFKQKGTLAWEYNPLRNYRLDKDMLYYKDRLWTYLDFYKEFVEDTSEMTEESAKSNISSKIKTSGWIEGLKLSKEFSQPIVYQKGSLVDFVTDEFHYDPTNPVELLPSYSYDDSVDLIINDGKNKPKLINSRFSAIGYNQYQIVDRHGSNDSNIYDMGDQFNIDTSLYKATTNIPEIQFLECSYGGNLKVGNYFFYFKYVDADGNESDFVGSSGLVSVFIGDIPNSINSGYYNQNSNKKIKFLITNTDSSYQDLVIYYTRATANIDEQAIVETCKFVNNFKISNNGVSNIVITGFEDVVQVSDTEINLQLQTYNSAKSHVLCQNRLFLGNVVKEEEKYDELLQCALNIYPEIDINVSCEVDKLSSYYNGNLKNTYYNPEFIYNYTGYWDDELYRFGVVFIKEDNTLSYVYNIRGLDLTTTNFNYEALPKLKYPVNEEETRSYSPVDFDKIAYDEYNYQIIDQDKKFNQNSNFENAKGVCYIPRAENLTDVIGIRFNIPEAVKKYLIEELNIKGFFFVRQKRIPTTLCQAYTINVDKLSHLPVLPTNKGNIIESFMEQEKSNFKYYTDEAEEEKYNGFALNHDVNEHIRILASKYITPSAAICPDYDVNFLYLNSLFNGQEFVVSNVYSGEKLTQTTNARLYETTKVKYDNLKTTKTKIIGVEDNCKLVGIDEELFSARAGEAEEAQRFAWIGVEAKDALKAEDKKGWFYWVKRGVKSAIAAALTGGLSLVLELAKGIYDAVTKEEEIPIDKGNNIVRGSFGPYLGVTGLKSAGDLINIKIPGYDSSLLNEYMEIRANDKTPFYAISDRIVWKSNKLGTEVKGWTTNGENKSTILTNITCYRGDCYISKFTHRVNRNFVDPSAPTNGTIVDKNCWALGIQYKDGILDSSKLTHINLGDINSVDLGLWVSMIVRSNINHSVRGTNESYIQEKTLFGHPRSFYPLAPLNASSPYKLPEAGTYNKGFERGVSEQISIEIPTVPFFKNNFSTRIAYSNLKINNAFENAYRTFPGTNYRDYPINYGAIVKLLELEGNIICVLEHGIFRIPVNERAVAASGDGGPAYINTHNILPENPLVLSDTYGSQWPDSIIQTPGGIYGVDTISKIIWKIDRDGGFSIMSAFSVQSFLNDNITLSERELTPVLGVKNVKTHYNAYKKDVMFTFYDDSKGFEEVVWNLCWNELLSKWITFYSWVPSFSENIYNQYFSFDRDSSKYITKLAMTLDKFKQNRFKVDNVIIDSDHLMIAKKDENGNLEKDENGNQIYEKGQPIGELIVNNPLYSGSTEQNVKETIKFKIIRDPFRNFEKFEVCENQGKWYIYVNDPKFSDNIIKITDVTEVTYEDTKYTYDIINGIWKYPNGNVVENSVASTLNALRKQLWRNKFTEKEPVFYLNIRMESTLDYTEQDATLQEIIATKNKNREINGGYVDYTIALIPREHLDALTTDFWKHGQSGIIDISEEVLPTKWYGKQHPFELEFVVNEKPAAHKIFDSLEIISNNAEPESFHYEIIGDSYEFAKDKKNMYIRQEATKALYQNLGSNITYNENYKNLQSVHRPLIDDYGNEIKGLYDKSTLFPLYYSKQDRINTVENYYNLKDGLPNKDYSALSGAEVIYDNRFKEFRIQNHAKAEKIDLGGRLRGNMQYKEDKWYVQINPLNLVQKNEPSWTISDLGNTVHDPNIIPIELGQSPVPKDIKTLEIAEQNLVEPDRGVVVWAWEESQMKEAKLKDKWIKIRIRYDGTKLAVVNAVMTLFSISYS